MQTNNHKIQDYDVVLDATFGKQGTPERKRAEEEAYSYYTSQMLVDARNEAGMTQSQLAEKIHSSKSYISRLEHGEITPSAGLFFQIMNALGIEVLFRKQASNFVL